MKLDAFWKCKTNPLEIDNVMTGQKILFRGMDNPLKVTSITVSHGVLNFVWIEEAYQIPTEESFDIIDESIRGDLPPGYFKQIILTFNPWHEGHWLKKRFFDRTDDPRVFATTTNYLCNEWLDSADRYQFEQMQIRNPRRYQTAGLGNWGVTEGLVLENWERQEFDIDKIRERKNIKACYGLDFGFTAPSALVFCLVDEQMHEIYICDELYQTGMSNKKIAEWIIERGYSKEIIRADAAEPKSIDQIRSLGVRRIRESAKGRDSVMHGIRFLQDFKIIIHPRCPNFESEISQYCWAVDKTTGKTLDRPVDDFNHLIDALRYATESISRGPTFVLQSSKADRELYY